ncbi:MAG: DUF4147 domain-containing protein [Trueperaceae bacterium]
MRSAAAQWSEEWVIALLRASFVAAVAAADPSALLPAALPQPPDGRLIVVAAGKAAVQMARAAWDHYALKHPSTLVEGVVIAPRQPGAHTPSHNLALGALEVRRAAHPTPDRSSQAATLEALRVVAGAEPGDHVLVLLSGGASALLCAPRGVDLKSKAELTRTLLTAGASIGELNSVRKHLSRVKGGQLAELALGRGARLTTLAVSDVAGDDPSTIGSGPTVPDPTTFAEALLVVERLSPQLTAVRDALALGVAGGVPETPKPGVARLAGADYRLVAGPGGCLTAVVELLRSSGVHVVDLGPHVEGEARTVGVAHAELVAELTASRRPDHGAVALVSGGELTVTVAPPGGAAAGVGGPNAEYALALLAQLSERFGLSRGLLPAYGARGSGWALSVLAADTDGLDGGGSPVAAGAGGAGALLSTSQVSRLSPGALSDALARHDSHALLASVGGLLVTGPTEVNVNDLRVVLLNPVSA